MHLLKIRSNLNIPNQEPKVKYLFEWASWRLENDIHNDILDVIPSIVDKPSGVEKGLSTIDKPFSLVPFIVDKPSGVEDLSANLPSGGMSSTLSYSEALYERGLTKASFRAERCGEPATLYCTNCGHIEVVKYQCGLRTCPVCSKRLSRYYVGRFYEALKQLPVSKIMRFRLITITTPLEVSRENVLLVRKWAGKFWKRICGRKEGVIASMEVGEHGHHLHVHAIHYGRFKNQDRLAKLWQRISDNVGVVVDVRALQGHGQGSEFMLRKSIKEVLKYATKTSTMSYTDLADLEYALKGSRRISTYGIFYRLERWLRAEQKSWVRVCPVCGGTTWYSDEGLGWVKHGYGSREVLDGS